MFKKLKLSFIAKKAMRDELDRLRFKLYYYRNFPYKNNLLILENKDLQIKINAMEQEIFDLKGELEREKSKKIKNQLYKIKGWNDHDKGEE
ncbi:MAG: hypothetical protein O2963_00070 [Proteobacteria bacterium]|nr:hypothetical protein [Pseudomonadota bacterium]